MMAIKKESINVGPVFFLAPFRNNYTNDELKAEIRNDKVLSKIRDGEITFILNDLVYAVCQVKNFEVINISGTVKKVSGSVGLRVTKDISKVRAYDVIKALDVYFGKKHFFNDSYLLAEKQNQPVLAVRVQNWKSENKTLNSFRQQKNLFCYLVRYSDEMNCSNFDGEKTVKSFHSHLGTWTQYSEGINNNMALRCQGSDIIPFHAFEIEYHVILKALNTLSFDYYMHLHMWYFDDLEIKFPEGLPKKQLSQVISRYYKYKNYKISSNPNKYKKSWRTREAALSKLVLRIIDEYKKVNI